MKLLEKILVPIDVNYDSTEQISAAINISQAYKSQIILMYVVPEDDLNNDIKEIITKSVTESLNEVKEIFTSNKVKVQEISITYGNIVENIVEKANFEKVNLILIGTRDKKPRTKYQLGVISENIIRESDIPVFLINTKKKPLFSHILCPVDFSGPSKRALTNAILLARKYHSTLQILTVYEPLDYISRRINIDLEEENKKRLKKIKIEMKKFIKKFDLGGVNQKIAVKCGQIEDKILSTIKNQEIDLLIMGTNGRTGISHFFMGSVTKKVIREMPCSFITVKRKDIIRLKLENEIKELEIHFKYGEELEKNAFYEEAIDQYLICLQVNDMHIPSMHKLAELYKKIGDNVQSLYYKEMAEKIVTKLWDKKIENEIRKNFKFGEQF